LAKIIKGGNKSMSNNEIKISDYIDRLNAGKIPNEHYEADDSPELGILQETVRTVRGLKEPAMPENDFPKRLAHNVQNQILNKRRKDRTKRIWFTGMGSVAAVLIIALVMNFTLFSDKTNIVYAMEQAYQDLKAYHGLIQISETNAEGENNIQGKLEVWADKKGSYYIKDLEGSQKGLITVNNGQKKWQIQPESKQVHEFAAFPDPYSFILELGEEVNDVKSALSTKVIGEDTVAGRKAAILEVTPEGGLPYRLWIDSKTSLPLQKQTAMQKSLQYTITYTDIDFEDAIPSELISYSAPAGYEVIDVNAEQIVNNPEEASEMVGFTADIPENMPEKFEFDKIAIVPDKKIIKYHYNVNDNDSKIVLIQGRAITELEIADNSIIGKVGDNIAEIQSPIQADLGILGGGGLYAGITDLTSIRWQDNGFEYAVVGNTALDDLKSFINSFTNEKLDMGDNIDASMKPQIEVPVDLEIEKNDQKSVDAGSSPWKLDPVYVSQVFVSLQISPEGIAGDYPINYEQLKAIKNDGKSAVVEVNSDQTDINKIYLKRLVRQDSTGIWTVVGYDLK
jgi:outer membrane lipoprotein-sorting protein